MSANSTLADFATALRTAIESRDADALRTFLSGGDLPLGEREPAEVVQDALQSMADREALYTPLAELLTDMLRQETRDLSAEGHVREPGRRYVLLGALSLAAGLPSEPHLFRVLKNLLDAEESQADGALRLALLHALIYQQTDDSFEAEWLRILADIHSTKPLSSDDRALLFEAWRGLLWIAPTKPRNGTVVDLDRVDRGLQAIHHAVHSQDDCSELLLHAFSILSDTFPRSLDFWRSRLGARTNYWPPALREAALQLWPGLRPVPIQPQAEPASQQWLTTLDHLLSQWSIARAGSRDAPSRFTLSDVKAFLLSREAECLDLAPFSRSFVPKPLSVSSWLEHRLEGSLKLAEVCWFVKPSPIVDFRSKYFAIVIGENVESYDLFSARDISEKLDVHRIADAVRRSPDFFLHATTREHALGTVPSEAADLGTFVSRAAARLPQSDITLDLAFFAPFPSAYFAALEHLQAGARSAAMEQLQKALKSAWHPLERRFLRAFVVIHALKEHNFEAALNELSGMTKDAPVPIEFTILALHAHAAVGSAKASREILESLKPRYLNLTKPARRACELIDKAFGISKSPSKRPAALEPEIIRRELEVLEVSASAP
jgi:hypothetical protein